eukprot:m.17793 g.17793  ORF g.17793 m.17793 type:complete len:418 (-) comp10697_c0_seq15:116-1369(-)
MSPDELLQWYQQQETIKATTLPSHPCKPYSWQQHERSITLTCLLPKGIQITDINVDVEADHVSVGLANAPALIFGQPHQPILASKTDWQLHESRTYCRLDIKLFKSVAVTWSFPLKNFDREQPCDGHSAFLVASFLQRDKDFEQAYKWLMHAAEANHSEALLLLSRIHSDIQLQRMFQTAFDESLALEYLLRAAELCRVDAMIHLSTCYTHGLLCLPHEPSLAQSWLTVALRPSVLAFDTIYNQSELHGTSNSRAVALYNLGCLLLEGDVSKALQLLEASAGLKSATAYYKLGELCQHGLFGVAQDLHRAKQYYLQAKALDATIQIPQPHGSLSLLSSPSRGSPQPRSRTYSMRSTTSSASADEPTNVPADTSQDLASNSPGCSSDAASYTSESILLGAMAVVVGFFLAVHLRLQLR